MVLKTEKEKTDEWLKSYIKTDWEMLIRSDCNILNVKSFEKTFEKISDIMTFEKALLILTGHGYGNRLHDAIRKDVGYAMQRLLEEGHADGVMMVKKDGRYIPYRKKKKKNASASI